MESYATHSLQQPAPPPPPLPPLTSSSSSSSSFPKKSYNNHSRTWSRWFRRVLLGGRQYDPSGLRSSDSSTTSTTSSGSASNSAKSELSDNQAHTNDDTPLAHVEVVYRSIQGKRCHMEDEVFISSGGQAVGVFDGHGGRDVSKYLQQHLYTYIHSYLASHQLAYHTDAVCIPDSCSVQEIEESIAFALQRIDQEILQNTDFQRQGSTVAFTYFHPTTSTLIMANIGDSKVVLCQQHKHALQLSCDHLPQIPSERKQIEIIGGKVTKHTSSISSSSSFASLLSLSMNRSIYRVNGNLSMSRAIGDATQRPFIHSQPCIRSYPIGKEDPFVIIASDGFWDVFSNQDAIQFTLKVS